MAHPGHREETKQRRVRPRSKARRRRQLLGSIDQLAHFLVGVDVRVWSLVLARKQIDRWHLGPRIAGAQELGELAHDAQSSRPLRGLYAWGQLGPSKCQVDRDEERAFVVNKSYEVTQQPLRPVQLETEMPAKREIVVHGFLDAAHR